MENPVSSSCRQQFTPDTEGRNSHVSTEHSPGTGRQSATSHDSHKAAANHSKNYYLLWHSRAFDTERNNFSISGTFYLSNSDWAACTTSTTHRTALCPMDFFDIQGKVLLPLVIVCQKEATNKRWVSQISRSATPCGSK